MFIESCAESASGDGQGRAPRSEADDLQMGVEAHWVIALCEGNQDEDLPLVARKRGVAGVPNLQPTPPGIRQCLQERIKCGEHLGSILPAQS
jgi:hypothetical protein